MHELTIVQNLLEVVLKEAERNGARRVTAIHIMCGEHSGVSPQAVEFYFQFLGRETSAGGALLSFRSMPRGRECYVESIEVE